MKFKIMHFVLISIAVLLVIFIATFLNENKYIFSILSTSYVEKKTTIQTYKNDNIINDITYPIGGVETINYDKLNNSYIIFDEYGDELLKLQDDETKSYKIKPNPIYLEINSDKIYIIHNEHINTFSIAIYDSDLKNIQNSSFLPGIARNSIIIDKTIYILANIYDENDNRTVGIYEIDLNTLEVKIFTELEKLTYGFFMEKYNNNLVVYGNSNEAKKDLTVYTYNLSNRKTTLRINSNHKAMWVNRVINLNDKKVILNSYSIISMTKDYKNLKVEYNDDSTLIDIVYDKDKGVFYLLKGYYEESIFEVIILDKNFSEINRIKLKNKDTIPTKIFLMG